MPLCRQEISSNGHKEPQEIIDNVTVKWEKKVQSAILHEVVKQVCPVQQGALFWRKKRKGKKRKEISPVGWH